MKFTKLLIVLVVLYGAALFFVIFAFNAGSDAQEGNDLKPSTSFLTTQDPNTAVAKALKKLPAWNGDSITGLKYNPFELLGAYPDPVPYIGKKLYHRPHFGLINENDYCDKVDEFNLEHPEHIFDEMNFYTDLFKNSLLKKRVMKDLGAIWNADMMRTMSKEDRAKRHNKWDKNITLFHITGELFYRFHEIGKHFMCATQVFSHIPNHTNLLQKDHFPQSVQDYKRIYKDRPQCYESISFPPTFRLFDQGECSEFFRLINSRKYADSLKTTPIQYLVKIGHGAHKAEGVFLLDQEETDRLNTRFNRGGYCGEVNNILIVQKYIGNPMLLDNNNKFHMRVYVLIASTNPLIVYYHDGYLRASIFPFDKTSTDRATHLTNLLMGDQVAEIAKNNNLISSETANMTVKELEDYYIWSFEELESYLIESGKTHDKNWLNNTLRPALQQAFVHVIRMNAGYFWKQSNVYEMFGCDFMLDDEMNVWFLEANPNPLLDGPLPNMITQMFKDLFEIEYALLRSRMKRALVVIKAMQKEAGDEPPQDVDKWREMYQEAVKNRLEPEYKLSETNTWVPIIDESLPGVQAYFGRVSEECLEM